MADGCEEGRFEAIQLAQLLIHLEEFMVLVFELSSMFQRGFHVHGGSEEGALS